jgi:beta-lactamase superfamily II metal-dependent hydrolase
MLLSQWVRIIPITYQSAKTITKLDNLNVKVYRTDELGTIIMQSDGNTIDVTTINADTNG